MSFQEQDISENEGMSYQEKKAIVSIISMILISAIYFVMVMQRYPDGDAYSKEVFRFWGTAILLLPPVSAFGHVIIYVIFVIINAIATDEMEPPLLDERDRLIELKVTRNALWVFIGGFFLAMGALALNMTPTVMFITLILGGLAAGIVSELSNLYYYRRGF